jgi:SAM-dependent methyltransferase
MANAEETLDFWQSRYVEENTPWDLGQSAEPFVDWLTEQAPTPGNLIALGAGRGHDAALFARSGFAVTAVDFAPGAVAEATRLYGHLPHFQAVQADIFDLPNADVPGGADWVLEHTCFCAIPPSKRPDYVQVVRRLLKPGGRLLALFWLHGEPDGPPYGGTWDEILDLFGPFFTVESAQPPTRSSRQHEMLSVLVSSSASRLF